jgi:hypothetical protein
MRWFRRLIPLPRSFRDYLPAIRGEDQPVAGAEVDLLEHEGLGLSLQRLLGATKGGNDLAVGAVQFQYIPVCQVYCLQVYCLNGGRNEGGVRTRPPLAVISSTYPASRSVRWV